MNCFVLSMFLTGLAGPQQKAGIFICLVQNNGENICAYIPWWRQNVNHGEISGTNQPSSESVIYCCLHPASLLFYLPTAPRWNLPKLAEISQSHTNTQDSTSVYFNFLLFSRNSGPYFILVIPYKPLQRHPVAWASVQTEELWVLRISV